MEEIGYRENENGVDAEKRVQNPWNGANKIWTADKIHVFLSGIGFPSKRYKDVGLFQQSCVHKSYVEVPLDPDVIIAPKPEGVLNLMPRDNEELEFIGDAILGAVMAVYLRRRYENMGEGFYTKLRTKLVNNKTLGLIAIRIGLRQQSIQSAHVERKCNGRNNLRILGSILEALIGAVFQYHENLGEDGWVWAQAFVQAVFEKYVDFAEVIRDDYNQKDKILKVFQSKFGQPPVYADIDTIGPPHDRIFIMGVLYPDGQVIATGRARSKKLAEQIASKEALIILEKENTNK